MTIYKISRVIGADGKQQMIREKISPDPVSEQPILQRTVTKIGVPNRLPTTIVTRAEIAEEICKIPKGRVVSYTDLDKYLAQKHNVEHFRYESNIWPLIYQGTWVPYWRVVSPKGYVGQYGFVSREGAKSTLETEGVPLEPSRRSYRVTDLDQYSYQFGKTEATN